FAPVIFFFLFFLKAIIITPFLSLFRE
ncbi:hypothetical protein SA269_07270, partial [Aggregatibacter actinomycetemcomitans serotype d str. SA269]